MFMKWKRSCCSWKVLGYCKSFFTAAARHVSSHAANRGCAPGIAQPQQEPCPGCKRSLYFQTYVAPSKTSLAKNILGKGYTADFLDIILQCPDSWDCGLCHDFQYCQRNTLCQQHPLSAWCVWFPPVALYHLLYLFCSLFTVFCNWLDAV